MVKGYISVRTALSDFTPGQDEGSGLLAVKKDQVLLLLDKYTSRPEWWKFKIKTDRQLNNGASGSAPKAQTEEAKSICAATACRDFVAQADGDLTITDHENLSVYCVDGDWVLVKGTRAAGYVPRECVKLEEEMDQAVTLFDFQATESRDLGFRKGETLVILDQRYEHWWRCKNVDKRVGMVPSNYLKLQSCIGSELVVNEDTTRPTLRELGTPISTSVSESTIVSQLVVHGCKDLSSSINFSSFSHYPVANGGFADVYRGQLFDGTTVAVRVPRISIDTLFEGPSHLKECARELRMWGKCHHPNILPLLGMAVFRDNIAMVSPWMGEGTLPRYLERTPGVNRLNLCHQICKGLSYLHDMGMIHRNLKGSNILASTEGVPLLSGFGNSQLVNQTLGFTETARSLGPRMSTRWTAPEIIAGTGRSTKSSDVYSLGMTIYEVLTGQIPYAGKNDAAVISLVLLRNDPPKRPASIPVGREDMDKLWELLLRCWSFKPELRPSMDEVMETITIIEALSSLTRKMAAQEVVSRLVARGCDDLSLKLQLSSFGDYPISHGGLSDIYRGQLLDGSTVAVKVLRVSVDSIALGSKHLKHAARELYTWSKCTRHPNIIPLFGLAAFRDRIGMVAPWMKNGSLPKYLKATPGANRYNMCVQICEGLSYLHHIPIVHCDLKGANVLVSDEGTPLLTDFGTSLASDQTLRFTATTGGPSYTLRWSPAEIINETSTHTKASDIYALGMTIFETMTGEVPYQGKNDAYVILQVANKKFPGRPECMPIGDRRSDKLWELLVRCWSYEPSSRPSADEVTEAMRNIV